MDEANRINFSTMSYFNNINSIVTSSNEYGGTSCRMMMLSQFRNSIGDMNYSRGENVQK